MVNTLKKWKNYGYCLIKVCKTGERLNALWYNVEDIYMVSLIIIQGEKYGA